MKQSIKFQWMLIVCFALINCKTKQEIITPEAVKIRTIEMLTDYGPITIKLYNETPLHRDNFLKLVNDKAYDGLLFHRVINEFMIQSGDPDSKNAKPDALLGEGDLPYTIPAEIKPNLYHKKGVLAAARDDNPERRSSAMQFYFVQGKVFNDSLLERAEIRINDWLAQHTIQKDVVNKHLLDSLKKGMKEGNKELYKQYNDSIKNWAANSSAFEHYTIPEAHRTMYKTIGGTPHLDQNYTVFGEIISGLTIVDSIAKAATNKYDRPVKDIRIQTVRVLE